MNKLTAMMLAFCMLLAPAAFATPATDSLLAQYKSEGASKADPAKAKSDWTREVTVDGEQMACATCHGSDFSKSGKHHKTGKLIKPMAPSVNPERFTDAKKIEKWLKRNCNDVWSRECTAQEKGDILKFLLSK